MEVKVPPSDLVCHLGELLNAEDGTDVEVKSSSMRIGLFLLCGRRSSCNSSMDQ